MVLRTETTGFMLTVTTWVILGIACLVAPGVSAQAITVSQEIQLKNEDGYDIIGKMGDHILLFRDQQNNFEIHAYDEAMRLRWERPLNFERNRVDIISLVPGEGSFHLVYGYRHKGDYYVKHRHYDADADVIDSTTIDVVEKLYFSPRYKHTYSQDKSKLLLFRVDKESEMFAYAYDLNKQETLWTKHISFKGGILRRDFRWMIVSNDA
ncbi:MAG: hypothetical protein R3330_04420, partial [Saprospiraceae bacterium]|nr:hypothetical protein [Saprospiraceae bacterium]